MTAGRRGAATAAASLIAFALAAGAPDRAAAAGGRPPKLQARAAIVVDRATGDVLYELRADQQRPIASATKLMTALLALERARPGDVFRMPRYRPGPLESRIDLRPGERMRVGDLIVALMLESANDAAVALAENIAGSRSAFVDQMNRRAGELGLRGTSFANPIGLDDPGNYSTARDLAALAGRLLRNRRFARTVDLPRATLRSGARRRTIDNRNDLVASHPFVDGVKTGHTLRAGYVLVGAGSRAGASVISVVLGEPSEAARNADTLALLRFGLAQFRRVRALTRDRALARAQVEHFGDRRVALVPARAVTLTLRRGERTTRRVDAPTEVEGPLPRGARVGSVTVLRRGRPVATVPLVTAEPVPRAEPLRRLGAVAGPAVAAVVVAALLLAAAVVTLRMRAGRRTATRAGEHRRR